ncbi:MAG TPA: hypothetical protein VMU25_04785 [Candidatus Paceibacterota bacterium]|nr:hypothetical protein [Candidatus Paceibacterota bacterium]
MADTHQQPVHAEEKKSHLWSDILTIIGFAIIFIIIIWGIVHLVSLVSSNFSSPSGRQTTGLQVTAPTSAKSGEPVTVTWQYTPSTDGGYAFVYQCQPGLGFKIQTGTSTSMQVRCGSALELPNGNNSIVVTPELTATSSVSDSISIVFIPRTGGAGVQGAATISISPAQKTTSNASGSGTTKTTQHVTHTENYNAGPADLAVRIISVSIDSTGAGVATFDIGNIGGTTSGSYYFTAQLPTAVPYPYQSPLQSPLGPGDHVQNTLRFTDLMPGGGLFGVSIVNGDNSPANDTASQFLSAPYTQPGYNYAPQPYTVYPTYNY